MVWAGLPISCTARAKPESPDPGTHGPECSRWTGSPLLPGEAARTIGLFDLLYPIGYIHGFETQNYTL